MSRAVDLPEISHEIGISSELLALLRCPLCGARLSIAAEAISCAAGHLLPMRRGYVDASAESADEVSRRTEESFGYEWTTFADLRPEDLAFWQSYVRDLPLNELGNAVALDVGCGMGRFTRFLAPHVRSLIALDASAAVEAAAVNLAELGNVLVVKADLRSAPLAPHSFDLITCLGVLHHLSDPRAGFEELRRLLAPGGFVLLYLYSRPDSSGLRATCLAAASQMRRLTTQIPHRLLRVLAAPTALLLYGVFVVPGAVGARLGISWLEKLPLHTYRNQPPRALWLDTFDRLSAPVEHRFVWSEIEPWFQETAMRVESVRESAGLFIVARAASAADPDHVTSRKVSTSGAEADQPGQPAESRELGASS